MDNNEFVEEVAEQIDGSEEVVTEKKGLSVVGLIFGIVSLLCCWFPGLNFIFALVGLILSIIGKKKVSKKTMGTVGMILSIIGIVLALLVGLLAIVGAIAYVVLRAKA